MACRLSARLLFFVCFALAVPTLIQSSSLVGQDLEPNQWNRFRGPGGGGVAKSDLPATWSDQENLAWKTDLPGKGSSSPVVWNDRVYITSYTGYGMSLEDPGDRAALMLHVLCFNIDDGALIWDCPIQPSSDEQAIGKRVGEHGYASPTPCVDASGIYAFFGPSGCVAISHDGQIRWRRNLGSKTVGFGAAASPILFGDLLIQNASIESGTLYGLDQSTGEIRWQTDDIKSAWTTPTIVTLADGSAELIVNQKSAIKGFDPNTGNQLWFCDAIQDYIVPCVVEHEGLLYCSGGRSNKTFVVRPGGRGDVSESHLVWEQSRGANVTSPIVLDGHLFWSHDKSIALCLSAEDGEELFRERMPTRSRVYGSIVSDGSQLFLTTRDAGVLVLAAQAEYKEIAVNKLGDDSERFNATPAIVGNRLILRSDQRLYCVSKDAP